MEMIEALACGTPVVSTPCGAAPEIVREGVTGVLRTCEVSLVKTLARVNERDRQACRRSVESYFSAERMVAEHVIVYERAIAAAGERRGNKMSRGNGRALQPIAS